MYYDKYIKYKKKYLQLKKIQEGGRVDCTRAYYNAKGTCWAIGIQTIITFGQATSNQLETIMKSFKPGFISRFTPFKKIYESKNKFIGEIINKVAKNHELNVIFPNIIFEDNLHLFVILDKFIDRYYSKVLEFNYTEKPEGIVNRENPLRCELLIADNFIKLFDYPIIKLNQNEFYGGNIITSYLLANLLSVFFLGYKLSFTNYYDNFHQINFDSNNNIGILIHLEDHVSSFYICNDEEKYYDNMHKKVINLKWINLLKESNKNNLYLEKKGGIIIINDFDSYEKKENLLKVLYLTVVSKHVQDSILDKDIQNILKFPNHDSTTINDIELQLMLGTMYYYGDGIRKDKSEAVRLYKLASSNNFAKAQYNLANMLYNGDGATEDKQESIRLYRLSAAQGYVDAQYYLGIMFAKGRGVANDDTEAVRLFRLAALQGHAGAQYYLGWMLAKGRGVANNDTEAVRWYRLAVEQGHTDAHYNLGWMIANGRGVVQNKAEAVRLYRLAAAHGHTDAIAALTQLQR